jgi:hypothetical protein
VAVLLTAAFLVFVVNVERKEFQRMPLIGRYIAPRVV